MTARRITDPKAIPVAGVDAHLPVVVPEGLPIDLLGSWRRVHLHMVSAHGYGRVP